MEAIAGILFVGNLSLDRISARGVSRDTFGGAALYGALASVLFNVKTGIMGIIGHDFPLSVVEDLSACQIDISGMRRVDDASIRFDITYDEGLNLQDIKAYNLMLSKELAYIPFPHALLNSDIVNIAPNYFKIQKRIISRVKKEIPLAKISLQSHIYHLKKGTDELNAILEDVDYLFLNEREAKFLSNKLRIGDIAKQIALQVKSLVCITRGPKGAVVAPRLGSIFQFSPPIFEVSDPTGAGDSFVGGFLATLLKEKNVVLATINGFTASSITLGGLGPCTLLKLLKKKHQSS